MGLLVVLRCRTSRTLRRSESARRGSRDPAEGVFAGQLFVTSFAWRCASGSPGTHVQVRGPRRSRSAVRAASRDLREPARRPLLTCSPVGVKGGALTRTHRPYPGGGGA